MEGVLVYGSYLDPLLRTLLHADVVSAKEHLCGPITATHTHTHTHTNTPTDTTQTQPLIHTHTHTQRHTHIRTRTHIYTLSQTHTHTYRHSAERTRRLRQAVYARTKEALLNLWGLWRGGEKKPYSARSTEDREFPLCQVAESRHPFQNHKD